MNGTSTSQGARSVDYAVQTVGDDELPDGIDHVLVERGAGLQPILFVSGTPARCWQAMCDYQDAVGTGKHGGAQVAWPAEQLLRAV